MQSLEITYPGGIWLASTTGVSFRIDALAEAGRTTIRLAGSLTVEAVPELLQAIGGEVATTLIDLSEVRSIDPVVASALRGFRERGARLVEANPYVELLLDARDMAVGDDNRPHGSSRSRG